MARITLDSKTFEKLRLVSSELNIKTKSVPDIIERLCGKTLELSKLIMKLSLVSKKTTLKDLFLELKYIDKLLTKKDKVMFYILKEFNNNRTVFLKSIIKRLSWSKPCKTQEAQNIVRNLEKQGLISLIKSCLQCGTSYNLLPDICDQCGHIFILQKMKFKDNRLRPRFAIELTDKGKFYINELINAYSHVYSFFNIWYKYLSLN